MLERLIRIALAFAVAFVFAGRMEAAAAHCAQLAQKSLAQEAAAPVAEIAQSAIEEASSCHEGGGHDMAQMADMPSSKAPAKAPAKHHDALITHCDCVGVLNVFASVGAAAQSTRIEPYEWARPEAAQFASIESSPGLRPPRA